MNKKIILASALSVLVLVGCSKITKDNYQVIEAGMDYQEIELLLGSPSSCDEALGFKQCSWGTEQRYIDIKFVADKVTFFSHKGVK